MVARKALFWQCFIVPTALKRFFHFPNQRSLQGPALLGLALVLLFLHALRLYFALDGQLHPDEAYYWAWSQKP
ncbi:MAG: hypothetical protein KDK33_17355, partial [Leptospiraceae bacterium]|nr:hypothetical protein [Leptospiraceae bacterium]